MLSVQPGLTVPSGEGDASLNRELQSNLIFSKRTHQTLMSWRPDMTTYLQVPWRRGGMGLHIVHCSFPCHFIEVATSTLLCCPAAACRPPGWLGAWRLWL